jgi:3-oxoacyl-[acyl-carrier-protein] synthase-1
MVTPVGFNASTSCAAMRAGIRNVAQSVLWDSRIGAPLVAGKVPLPQWWTGLEKLADLAAPAINECLAFSKLDVSQVPIILGVCGPDRLGRPEDFDRRLFDVIGEKLGGRLHPKSGVLPRDRVSGAQGLLYAQRVLEAQDATACVVAGVDSLLHGDLVDHYLEQRRILTPDNSNGFSPGEAGSAVLVVASGQKSEIQILGIGFGRESATVESDEPLRGEGLTDAVRSALTMAALRIEDVHYRITDLNGEHYRFKEMALAMLRFERQPRPQLFDLWHPAEFIGDVGAAIGPLAFGIGLHAGHYGYGTGPTVLYTFGNDDGARAAVIGRFVSGDQIRG